MSRSTIALPDCKVRAVLAGATQHREIVRQPQSSGVLYGEPGARLAVREACAWSALKKAPRRTDTGKPFVVYLADGEIVASVGSFGGNGVARMCWTPAVQMPPWASRITVEITAPERVELIQCITEADAQAEGVPRDEEPCDHVRRSCDDVGCLEPTHRASFADLWMDHGWRHNAVVRVVTFKLADRRGG